MKKKNEKNNSMADNDNEVQAFESGELVIHEGERSDKKSVTVKNAAKKTVSEKPGDGITVKSRRTAAAEAEKTGGGKTRGANENENEANNGDNGTEEDYKKHLTPEELIEVNELREEIREHNRQFFAISKQSLKITLEKSKLMVPHLKAAFQESEFTEFLGEIFGGMFCKTKAIEEKMEELDEKYEESESECRWHDEEARRLGKIRSEIIEKAKKRAEAARRAEASKAVSRRDTGGRNLSKNF